MRERNVAVLILHDRGNILLQKRGVSAERFPNTWGLFGGGIKPGETPEQAIRREALEETGLGLNDVAVSWSEPYQLPERGEQGTIFVCAADYDGSPLTLREGEDMGWFPVAEALALPMNDVYRRVIGKIVQKTVSMVS
jgi:8-oxo-dGTP diphosphatase